MREMELENDSQKGETPKQPAITISKFKERLAPLRALDFNLGNLANLLIVVIGAVGLEYIHYKEEHKFEPEKLLTVTIFCIVALIILQVINSIVLSQDNRHINDLMKRIDRLNADLGSARLQYVESRQFYQKADELIAEFIMSRDDFEQKFFNTIYDLPLLSDKDARTELAAMETEATRILENICATTCAVISLRKHHKASRFSANIKTFVFSEEEVKNGIEKITHSYDPHYEVIARSTHQSAARGKIDKINGARRFGSNYFFSQLFSPYNEPQLIFNNIAQIVGDLGPEFNEPNGKTRDLYSCCLMTKIIGDPYIAPKDAIRADNRCYIPDVRGNALGVLTVDSNDLTFDRGFDTSIIAEMSIHASSILRMYDMIAWSIKTRSESATPTK